MKNTTLFAVVLIALIAGGIFFFANSGKSASANSVSATGNAVSVSNTADTKDIQKITIGFGNSNYYPNTITVKAGKPVEITLDNSVRGCYRSFVIKQFGVSQYSRSPDQKIVFTPNEKGTFAFACGMGMGRGTIVVE